MTAHVQLAQRARRYARTRCPRYAKGWPMQACVQRYALRLAQRAGPWQALALTLTGL